MWVIKGRESWANGEKATGGEKKVREGNEWPLGEVFEAAEV